MVQDWVREELERAAREEIRDYLASDATVWMCGDGISAWEHRCRLEDLEWIERIAEAIGQDRAKAIWEEVDAEIRSSLAEMARLVVGDHFADSWLAGVEATPRPVDPEILAALGEDHLLEAFPGFQADLHAGSGDDLDRVGGTEKTVQRALWAIQRASRDRDLFDQLGLPETYWKG